MNYQRRLQAIGESIVTNNNRKVRGGVSPRSLLTDSPMKRIVAHLSKELGITVAEIEDIVNESVQKFEETRQKSPVLYDSIAMNIVENTLFKLANGDDPLDKGEGEEQAVPRKALQIPKGCAEFDPVTFYALVRRVKAENPSMFPLRNFFNKKPLAAPRIILVPTNDKADQKFNQIDTAAASPNGEFIFNTKLMQQLMNFSFIKGEKPKSKKYESNGGTFPDEWDTVEFVIMHEFYHYTHGDFHYQKVMGGNPTVHNWAGDFRSNYDLIKAGYSSLPLGLHSDKINYDQMHTYREMYETVLKEFEKLSKDQKEQLEKQFGEMGDDHSEHASDQDPSHGMDPDEGDLEKHSKEVSKKAGAGKDGAVASEKEGEGKPQPKADKGGPGSRSSLEPQAVDWTSIRPRYDWKTLLARLVRAADTTEVTYQKVHRRNITGVHVATQTGAGVIRPGEKEVPANLVKLCIVIDSSGSMHEAIKPVFANLHKLLNENQSAIAKQFALVEFSGDHRIYACTVSGKSGTAVKINGVEGMKSAGSGERIDLAVLLARHEGGSTNFDGPLVDKLKEFVAQKYNVLIMTDSDIVGGSNKANFLDLYSTHHQQVYLLLDSRETYTNVITTLKQASANVSHL